MAVANRFLQEIDPSTHVNVGSPESADAFETARALIVLGDPGAGKTSLLRRLSAVRSFRSARLASEAMRLPGGDRIAIDGVDEVSDDVARTLAAILSRLEAAGSPSVVLSCRLQDWHAAGAIADFEDVYGAGSVRVCLLLPLDVDGAKAVLVDEVDNPDAFLEEAHRRGLNEFLRNPNDLKLLAAAVREGWPSNRSELMDRATRVVLSESNREHKKRRTLRGDALQGPAGWICSSLLLSGHEDILLDEEAVFEAAAGRFTRAEVFEALGSRAFTATTVGRVQPAHRTIAEYLAGRWLGTTMDTAKKAARVEALLFGPDGAPPTAFRSLFAWTFRFMSDVRAGVWLSADPVALVNLGDVAVLTSGQRLQLLEQLVQRAAVDPDLGSWSSEDGERWTPLLTEEALPRIVGLLQDPTTPKKLVQRLLNGVRSGSPSELQAPLLALANRPNADDYLKGEAIGAYLALRGDPAPIRAIVARLNGTTDEDRIFRMRSAALHALPGLTGMEVAAAVEALRVGSADVAMGRIAHCIDRLDNSELERLLDQLLEMPRLPPRRRERSGREEADYVLARVVTRLLDAAPAVFTDDRLIGMHDAEIMSVSSSRRHREALDGLATIAEDAAFRLFTIRVLPGPTAELWSRFVEAFRLDGFLRSNAALWHRIAQEARMTADADLACELCLCTIHAAGNQAMPAYVFDNLYDFMGQRPELLTLRWKLTSRRVRPAAAARVAKVTAPRDARELAEMRTRIEADRPGIASWTALDTIRLLGELYAGYLEEERIGSSSRAALYGNFLEGLGEELAEAVADDLRTGLLLARLPAPAQLAAADSRPEDLAAVAAMDLLHARAHDAIEDPTRINDRLAATLLIYALEDGRPERDPYSGEPLDERRWSARLVATRPQVAKDAIMAYAVPVLLAGAAHVAGTYQIAHDPSFATVRSAWALDLLAAAPDMESSNSRELFKAVLDGSSALQIGTAAASALAGRLGREASWRWTAAAWLHDPDRYGRRVALHVTRAGLDAAWTVIETLRLGRRRSEWSQLSERQLVFLLRLLAPAFPFVAKPAGWSGSRKPWDGSDVLEELIGALGRRATTSAGLSLSGLIGNRCFVGYRDQLRRAALDAAAGVREGMMEVRDLATVARALLGGPPLTLAEAVAIAIAELRDLQDYYRTHADTGWHKFWSFEDDGRRVIACRIKNETVCCKYLLADLRMRLAPFAMRAEEATVNDDRIDIAVDWNGRMFPIEVKLEDNRELWSAAGGQLGDRYVEDYRADGLGIYLVLWTGEGRGKRMPAPADGTARPTGPVELEAALRARLPGSLKERISVVVVDLSRP